MIFNKEETRNLLNMLRSSDKENAILAFESLKKVDIKTYIGELIVLYKFGNTSPEDWETNCSKCVKALGKRKILTGAYNALSSGVCLAHMTNNSKEIQEYQKSEVRNIKWVSFEECINCIRPYNLEKINIIEKINKVLQEYRLY